MDHGGGKAAVMPAAHSAAAGMQSFELKEYDVTSNWEAGCGLCCTCCIIGWTTTKLTLDPDEAVLKKDNSCCHSVQKRPYAQLGHVDSNQACGCCWGVTSDLTGYEGEISPGCGCSEGLVKEIIEELQARKLGRGNVAQLKAQEQLAARVDHMDAKLDAILKHLSIPVPPAPALALPVVQPSMQRQ